MQSGNGEDLRRLHRDILGPIGRLELGRFARWRWAIQRLYYPWDAAVISAIAVGLYGTALLGALVVIRWEGSLLASIGGIVTIGVAAGLASHLVVDRS